MVKVVIQMTRKELIKDLTDALYWDRYDTYASGKYKGKFKLNSKVYYFNTERDIKKILETLPSDVLVQVYNKRKYLIDLDLNALPAKVEVIGE